MIVSEEIDNEASLANKRVLITGADGMLGRAFQSVLASDYPSTTVFARTRNQLDVTKRGDVLAEERQGIQVIVHCAADVDADRSEQFPERCREIQVGGTANVISLAKMCGATVFYPQSFLIYGRSNGCVDENTPPEPKSTYAVCKLEAEQLLLAAGIPSLVVRMGGFFGGEERDKNFVGKFTRTLDKLMCEGIRTYAVGSRRWQPSFTEDLARNSLSLLNKSQRGVWCMSGEGEASFHDVARACVRLLHLEDRMEITAAKTSAVAAADVAPRPARVVMSNEKLKRTGLYCQRYWQDALAEYLSRPWFEKLFRSVRSDRDSRHS
jgi:dTDP-4-dehydrorhamnose reductase